MKSESFQYLTWNNLEDNQTYIRWRDLKLANAEAAKIRDFVTVKNFANPTDSERKELILRCSEENLAGYQLENPSSDPEKTRFDMRKFAAAMGLTIAEAHRSAGDAGIVALTVTDAPKQAGYIPYTPRPLSWHTDGYYNAPDDRIGAFVLHCVRPALTGGENMLLDPEIAYIRLRDESPGLIRALMHPAAMVIPENSDETPPRPVSVGPVFFADPDTGRMNMRYTARTRSISWRDDPLTELARQRLLDVLNSGDPLALNVRLKAGQGVLNNNVLHNRTGFENGDTPDTTRLVYRVRFCNRLNETPLNKG